MKAYVAVQKKLLLLAYALWRHQTKYVPRLSTPAETEALLTGKPDQIDKKIVPTSGTTAPAARTGSIHHSRVVLWLIQRY